MKKFNTILAILGAVALCTGCSNDSSSGGSASGSSCSSSDECEGDLVCSGGNCVASAEQGGKCADDEGCADGLRCNHGKCVKTIAKGEACEPDDEEAMCASGLACMNGECANAPGKGESCAESGTCADGLKCKDGYCVLMLSEGAACESESTEEICASGLICTDGKCKAPEVDPTRTCKKNEDCAEYNQICGTEKYCTNPYAQGDLCDSADQCQEGLDCNGQCVVIVNEGESCGMNFNTACPPELECLEDVCRAYQSELERGSECNEQWLICKNDLQCKDGHCIQYVAEEAPCDEDAFIYCETGKSLQCLNKVCKPVGDFCTTSEECTEKDSYCCVSDTCAESVKNKCVTYDENTKNDPTCKYVTKPGIFEAQIQCRWPSLEYPLTKETYNGSTKVEIPPLVGHFGNSRNLKTTIAFWSYDPKVLRIIDPETCETLDSLEYGSMHNRWHNYPAAADLNGDGYLEIVVVDTTPKPIAFRYNETEKKYVKYWEGSDKGTGYFLKTFDVNGDGKPEVILGAAVYEGTTGKRIANGNAGNDSSIGYMKVGADNVVFNLAGKYLYIWDKVANAWKSLLKADGKALTVTGKTYQAYADFGTPGDTANKFDFTKLDGQPEFVGVSDGTIVLEALHVTSEGKNEIQQIMSVELLSPVSGYGSGSPLGGPLTIGDFDNDGLPEIGIASSGYFGVYDPLCKQYEAGKCADKYVLWERWSQDASSGRTGSTLFDFDGDGQAEAVYGDECFTRVYDGKTGKVLFSSKRGSGTAEEAPVVADVDGDGSAEIIMGSPDIMKCYNDEGKKIYDGVDPIHEGIPCTEDADCPTSKNCNKELGLCTCTEDKECNTQYLKDKAGKDVLIEQYVCAPPIHPNVGFMVNADTKGRKLAMKMGGRPDNWKNGDYKVCRATRKSSILGMNDLVVLKDRLDRWVSSRDMWNQHAYNIINVKNDGKVPSAAEWIANWLLKRTGNEPNDFISGSKVKRPVYNNYRLNEQGLFGAGTVPDITARFIADSICGKTEDGRYVISGNLCNRGTKPVSKNLPATFYYYDENAADHRGKVICTSLTPKPVGIGECEQVGCEVEKTEFDKLVGKEVLMISNDNGSGGRSTDECNYNNNTDRILVEKCAEEVEIVN